MVSFIFYWFMYLSTRAERLSRGLVSAFKKTLKRKSYSHIDIHYFLIFLRVWSLKRENHSRVLIILKNLISFRSGKKTIDSYLICRQELADNSSTSTEQSWFNKLKSNSHVAKFCPSISIFYIAKGTLFMCTRKNEIKRLWIWVATSCLVNYSWVAFAQ